MGAEHFSTGFFKKIKRNQKANLDCLAVQE